VSEWPLITAALVALGGAAGALLRVWVTAAIDRRAGARLPWGTLAVNLTGSAVLGFAAALALAHGWIGHPVWLGLAAGVLGSYTTVSSFALQGHALAAEGRGRAASVYAAVSVAGCIAVGAAGLWLGRVLTGG
jgi:fluoride exporter